MTESYAFFGGTPEDPRQYNQIEFAEVLERFFRNGYFPGVGTEVAVFPTDPARLAVRVGTGQAWINGYWYKNDTWKEIDLAPADDTNDRIDRIVLRLDTVNARNIEAVVKTGIPAVNPTAPDLERTEQIYELSLATVRVNNGATSITASNITDTRDDEIVCGRAVPWNVPTDEDLYQHVSDNVRHITASERSSWNAKETPAGAQAKADAAEQAAKAYTDAEVGTRATKTEFNAHVSDNVRHITASERSSWNQAATNTAKTNVDNNFTITQTFNTPNVTGNWTVIRMKRDQNGVGDYGLSMRNDGRLSIWDYINERTLILFGDDRIVVGAGADLNATDANGIKVANQPVWYAGNQGNPNNLNTSSKQIVGAINELFTTVSDGKQAIRDAIADAGGTPPSGSPNQYTHQDLAAAISTVSKYASGEEPTSSTTSMTVQVRGIDFSEGAFYFFYQTNDDGAVSGMFRLDQPYNAFIRQSNTVASAPTITPVTGGFDITISRPADTGFDWEAWGK